MWSSRWRSPARSTSTPCDGTLTNDAGEEVRLEAPVGEELPAAGFDPGESGFESPPDDRSAVTVEVSPDSERLQLLAPFDPWDGNDYVELPVLLKAKGKCTTDHISAAGPLAQVPGPSGEHLRQPLPGSGQRLPRRRGAGHGQGPARRRDPAVSRRSPSSSTRLGLRGSPSATRTTARAARASMQRWSRASATARRSSCAASPASTRPTSRSRACCR